MTPPIPAQELFLALAEHACARVAGNEVVLLNYAGENSDFVRFNRSVVRQATAVRQHNLQLTLIDGQRQESTGLALSGDPAQDRRLVDAALADMRHDLPRAPLDPHLLYCTEARESCQVRAGRLPAVGEAIGAICRAGAGSDLVGIFASGPIYRGFASSLGARHWHAVDSFQLDWSLFLERDLAVKSNWAGQHWDAAQLGERIESARLQLPFLARPAHPLGPGRYRAYLAPMAVAKLVSMLSWEGVSAKAQQSRQSPLQQLVDGRVELSAMLNVREHTAQGLAPGFDSAGFLRPAAVEVVREGRHVGPLVSARSAREFGLVANGADDAEGLISLDLGAGRLAAADIPAALDTGLFVSNLWYLNWSDRGAARVTGMTRFACFWVEDGRIVAPVGVMRFDDSLYSLLGPALEALTRERDWLLDAQSWGERSVETARVPGALLRAFTLTL